MDKFDVKNIVTLKKLFDVFPFNCFHFITSVLELIDYLIDF